MKMDLQNAILIVLCLVLLLGVFTLSAQAAFENQPIAVGATVDSHRYPNRAYATLRFTTAPSSYFLFTVNRSLYAVFTDAGSYSFVVSDTSGLNGTPAYSGTVSSQYNGYYYLEVYKISSSYNWNTTLLSNYSTYQQGIDAIVSNVGPNVPPTPPATLLSLEYTLPPGNVAFIHVPSSSVSYTLRTRMPESVLGSNHYPGNNQVLTLVNNLPTGGTSPSSPLIPWQQDGALSILGLSRNAVYSATNASAGYLCIVNPLYYSGTANGPYEFLSNGAIEISIDSQDGIWVYPLDSSLGFTSGLGINVDTEILNEPYEGEVNPDTGEVTWTDSNGGSSAPTTGGGNLVSTSETIFDFLRNIADEIATFLRGPIQAIQTVVSAIRQFLSSFTQLYMWLPSPVYNLITSALMIALTIGVIKIFV